MKTKITKRLFAFILLISGMFSITMVKAQNCSSNKVWACRYDACGIQECKCINASQVQSWTEVIPPCNGKNPWLHCCHGGTWRIGQDEAGDGNISMQVHPNPVSAGESGAAIISFFLHQSQRVSLRIFDLDGRLITILADNFFEEGENEATWNVENANNGIYLLQFVSGENSETVKLVVAK